MSCSPEPPTSANPPLDIKSANRKKRKAVYRAKKRRETATAATASTETYDPLADWTDNHLNGYKYFYRTSKYTPMQEAIKYLKPEPNAKPPRSNMNVNQHTSKPRQSTSSRPRTKMTLPTPLYK